MFGAARYSLLGFVLLFAAFCVVGCYEAHELPDGSSPRPTPGGDAAVLADGTTPLPSRDSGTPLPSRDSGADRFDAGDVFASCVAFCDHLGDCIGGDPPADCLGNCMSLSGVPFTPECRTLVSGALECLVALDCSWFMADPEESPCGPRLREVESRCDPSMGGGGGGGGTPPPAP